MPPTTTNGKSAYSTSAPRKSPPNSPSIFVFPEKTSRSGVSPPRYGRQNTYNSSSTSSWDSQGESPKYGEQKTPDSANTSFFSEEDSSYSPFSPSFEYHVDSATLFGDGKFKSPCSAPKPSCPLESKAEPTVSHRPPLSPGPYTPPADTQRDLSHRYSLFLQTLKLTPKRESPGPRELPAFYEYNTSLDVSAGSAQSGKRQWRYSDSSDIVTSQKPIPSAGQEPAQTKFQPDKRRYGLYMPQRQQFPLSGRKIGASLGSSSKKHHRYFSEAQASTPHWTPPPLSASVPESDKRKSRYSLPNTKHIIPASSPHAPPSADITFDNVRENDSRRRVTDFPPSYLEDPSSKSAPEKKHRKLVISALRMQPRNIKKLCCNLARKFSNREPATHFSQDYSGKQPPDSRKQPLRTLAASTFNSFISQPDLVGVMFHNSTTNKPGTLEDWTTHSKSNSGANQLFASVDCAKEASLCASEGVSSLPFYKLYSKGSTVKAVKDLGRL